MKTKNTMSDNGSISDGSYKKRLFSSKKNRELPKSPKRGAAMPIDDKLVLGPLEKYTKYSKSHLILRPLSLENGYPLFIMHINCDLGHKLDDLDQLLPQKSNTSLPQVLSH